MQLRLSGFLFFALAGASYAQEKLTPGDEMIHKYLAAQTDKLSLKFLDGAKTLEQWQQKLPRLREEYFDMLGLWPYPEKTPLNAVVTKVQEAHGVVVENLHFQSKPGLYVTANFYRPKSTDKPLPSIVYVCGHANRGRDGCKSAHQDHGFWFANNGYTCLILDTLQLGEIAGIHHGTYGLRSGKGEAPTRMWWHSAGYTPAGVEAWNGVRAIDYLLTRREVDAERIGVTGISGGGAATFWIAAADPRVKVAVPVSGMADLESYVKNKIINGHCDCMFLYNTYQWDWTTIAALVAPRPMLFANSDNDPIFPMDANRRVIAKLRQVYELYGKKDLVDEYVSAGGHAYRPDLRVAIFKFFNKHLKGDAKSPVEDSAKYTPLEGRLLRAFPEDADIPKDQVNTRADEVFVPRAKATLPEKEKFAAWQKEAIRVLRNQLKLNGENPKVVVGRQGIGHSPIFDVTVGPDRSFIVVPNSGEQGKLISLVVDDFRYKNLDEIIMRGTWWSSKVGPDRYHVIGFGLMKGAAKSPPNFLERSHLLLGTTIERDDLQNIVAIVSGLKRGHDLVHGSPVRLAGQGRMGVMAVYAALLNPGIDEVLIVDPPTSHMDGPHFPGILRVIDIPEALGLLAPRPLTIIGGKDKAFDRTAEIYRLAGAAEKLTRK